MKYLFIYKYLREQAARASTNWTNWKNASEVIRFVQLFQFVLLAGARTHAHVQTSAQRLSGNRGGSVFRQPAGRAACSPWRLNSRPSEFAGPSQPLPDAGHSRPEVGLVTKFPKGVK